MTDGQDRIVEGALSDCAEEFERGVHSFHGSPDGSDLIIDDGVVDELKGLLRDTFAGHLRHPDPAKRREWQRDKERVSPVGFYAGALAALYAHNAIDDPKRVTERRARCALEHASTHCQGLAKEASEASGEDLRVRWIYCPTWPAARVTEDDVVRAIEKSEVVLPPATDLKRSKKTVTVGCVKIPLPFLKLEVCVDLRFNW